MSEELLRLEGIAANSIYSKGANFFTIEYSFDVFKRFIKGMTTLEMGPAEGVMTAHLVNLPQQLTVVEGSSFFCEGLKEKFKNIEVVNSLFEDFKPEKKYDNIILGHVLEHVENPAAILGQLPNWLSAEGIVLAAVPNAHSLHRQAAVHMGILNSIYDMSEQDRSNGHRRIYDWDTLRKDFEISGLNVVGMGGYWLKPISNKQIEENWTEEMLIAFMKLGEEYPQIAGEIYIVASKEKK